MLSALVKGGKPKKDSEKENSAQVMFLRRRSTCTGTSMFSTGSVRSSLQPGFASQQADTLRLAVRWRDTDNKWLTTDVVALGHRADRVDTGSIVRPPTKTYGNSTWKSVYKFQVKKISRGSSLSYLTMTAYSPMKNKESTCMQGETIDMTLVLEDASPLYCDPVLNDGGKPHSFMHEGKIITYS